MRLVVFDTEGAQVLITLAQMTIDEGELVANSQRAVFTSELDFQATGGVLDGIVDGEFTLGATAALEQGCPTKVSAVGIGHLDVNVEGAEFDLVVPKLKLRTAGDPIASVDLP